jgi:hypothetical protein
VIERTGRRPERAFAEGLEFVFVGLEDICHEVKKRSGLPTSFFVLQKTAAF